MARRARRAARTPRRSTSSRRPSRRSAKPPSSARMAGPVSRPDAHVHRRGSRTSNAASSAGQAQRLGYTPSDRETAQLADGHRARAETLVRAARDARGPRTGAPVPSRRRRRNTARRLTCYSTMPSAIGDVAQKPPAAQRSLIRSKSGLPSLEDDSRPSGVRGAHGPSEVDDACSWAARHERHRRHGNRPRSGAARTARQVAYGRRRLLLATSLRGDRGDLVVRVRPRRAPSRPANPRPAARRR